MVTDQPAERPIEALIRRANAYAHHEYYGQGLADCIADNHRIAEEAEAALRASIAHRIRAELVCCDLYGRVNDGDEHGQEARFRAAVDSGEYARHDLCYWGEGAARLAENRSDGPS